MNNDDNGITVKNDEEDERGIGTWMRVTLTEAEEEDF